MMRHVSFLVAAVAMLSAHAFSSDDATMSFDDPVDAVSVEFSAKGKAAEVSGLGASGWSEWLPLAVEDEQDPTLLESNLAMFPESVSKIRIRTQDEVAVHPVRVSKAPVTYDIAALNDPGAPRIYSREDWAADDSLLYARASTSSSAPSEPVGESAGNGTPSQRVQDCEEAQLNYPDEFKVKRRVTTDDDGKRFLWTREYSKRIDVIAVHHTAIAVGGDKRSGAERVRALYQYHAINRGWGDVGYHYLIDEDGKIYEGKSGGKYVIGGHAYCNNTNTLGVALLGNFEEEQPTQKQLKALQALLGELADEYEIDVKNNVKFHGKTMPAIVGHQDLVSTECPGYYVYGAMDRIRTNVANGDYDASVTLPKPRAGTKPNRASSRAAVRRASTSSATGTPRRVQRILESRASQELRRKLGSNPGKEIEDGTAARRAARLGSSVSSSSRARSSASSVRSVSSSSSRSRTSSVRSISTSRTIRIRLVSRERGEASCADVNINALKDLYRGSLECELVDGAAAIINEVTMEDYLLGLAEEPDTEPYEKQRAFAIAARTYATYYRDSGVRKFPGKPYDGSDSPATFQKYTGKSFEKNNPNWLKAVKSTAGEVLKKDGVVIRPPYFSSDDGRTRTPAEAGWKNFPHAEIYFSKDDPWCAGMPLNGHGVGMSGCGSEGMANDGKTGEKILEYYYPGTTIEKL